MTLAERIGPLLLGTLAVVAGALFLWDVGALAGMGTRNVGAFVIGLPLGWASWRLAHQRHGAAILFSLATVVLVLVLTIGIELDGVQRWLSLGPVRIQPALILAPLLLAIVASRDGRHWRAAVLAPILLVAAQPDAATLGGLVAGVLSILSGASLRSRVGWSYRRIAIAGAAVTIAVIGLLVAGIQTPPPVAFVEGTAQIAILSGGIAILLHVLAIALALAALIVRHQPAGHAIAAYLAVSAVASIFWAFPMPVVGAGPSHLIGFGLAIGWLATARRADRLIKAG